MRRLKITSDGTLDGTRLVDEQTGEPVYGVKEISWKIQAEAGASEAIVTFLSMKADMVGEFNAIPHTPTLPDQ